MRYRNLPRETRLDLPYPPQSMRDLPYMLLQLKHYAILPVACVRTIVAFTVLLYVHRMVTNQRNLQLTTKKTILVSTGSGHGPRHSTGECSEMLYSDYPIFKVVKASWEFCVMWQYRLVLSVLPGSSVSTLVLSFHGTVSLQCPSFPMEATLPTLT